MQFARGSDLVARPSFRALWLPIHRLVIVGFLAIAASGVVAWAMDIAFGDAFVAGDAPGVTYTADRCAELFEYAPGARTCEGAAAMHHAGEVIQYRIATLALALVAWLGYITIRRAGHRSPAPALEATMGATAFGLAGVVLLALAANAWVLGPWSGAGQYLSAALVALPIAAVLAVRAYHEIRA